MKYIKKRNLQRNRKSYEKGKLGEVKIRIETRNMRINAKSELVKDTTMRRKEEAKRNMHQLKYKKD